jgi:hypothetical protein
MNAADSSGMHGLTATAARLPEAAHTDDRLIRARIAREREEARLHARITERQATAQLRREDTAAKRTARDKARQDRAARLATAAAWCQDRTIDLLFVPVIGVPGALAWTGMASYGQSQWGTPGLALPAFSEGGMWAFAAATTITRHRNPDKPTWHLRLGTLLFAAWGAALNFLHGYGKAGLLTGVSMALISVAGVTAHQLITAGPRRSRADREQARMDRAIARRERAARCAAVRRGRVQLDATGHARLVFEPGIATLSRDRLGRRRLEINDDRSPVLDDASVRIADPVQAEAVQVPEPVQPTDDHAGCPYAPVDRNAVVAELADQIRDAVRAGEIWRPNYSALMEATGRKRSWCEKVVHDARVAVLEVPACTDNG